MGKIQMLVMDVDGTLTDGKIYMGTNGEVMKAFDVKDGYGIANILPKYNIIPVIITGRESDIVKQRAKELNITELYQGIKNKSQQLLKVADKYHIPLENIAFIGDDLNDMECINLVGLSLCPSNAVDYVKEHVKIICQNTGGNGAVREAIEHLI